ncbi:indolepyruvate decarboxylase [Gregarina niphandrodes]|uniref:Indolepyruvate decarboxylase n=1 Tax=Gregarina niphandrodes TaxID=110365 RepID=A0A023B8J9_GRENI|nr:indolepyruvate decarboxylase [Gregarina niphandrodes]EZG69130.1 indolepyruvate decarboxylase [Gregarina niphandrodes]|eukprot:XP_011134479.1 indolepyruvate decarboxylase [Gregarina niphandrodes]
MVKLGEFLCQRLKEAGCDDVFGVPGDFNLGLFNYIVASELNYVGCCNELNSAYAADGYARVKGLGCCATTYAVGELSAVNGIAGAFAESVPVVKIVGGPMRKHFKEMPLLHHTLGDYMTPYKMYEPITVDQCVLNDPRFAARDIDRVLTNCLLYKRPVYILVPSDMPDMEIDTTDVGEWKTPVEPASEPSVLEEALEEVVERLRKAKHPVFVPGVELIRRGLQDYFQQLTTKSHIPYATMLLSKGLISETHPNFMGLYMGQRSLPEVREAIANSDCVVIIGEKLTDFNTGGFTSDFNPKSRIIINYDNVSVSSHSYNQVYIGEFLRRLVEMVPVFPDPAYEYPRAKYGCPNRRDSVISKVDEAKLDMRYIFKKLAKILPEKCILIAETGASMFSAAETMLPDGGTYIGQTFYGSIGYTVGSCLGACIALREKGDPSRRVVLSVGDGSFQLTAQEVSTMIRYNCNPVILLINNDGYTIERVITDNIYNDIQMWDYASLPKIFGGKQGIKATTHGEFDQALSHATSNPDDLVFIEAVIGRLDCNRLLKCAGRMMAMNNKLQPSITEEMLEKEQL